VIPTTPNVSNVFNPSVYQIAFFNELTNGRGDILLSAVAGSGKTKSIEEGINRIPGVDRLRVLATAFNKHIETELKGRQGRGLIPRSVTVSTIHGLGYKVLAAAFPMANRATWVEGRKYTRLSELLWSQISFADLGFVDPKEAQEQKILAIDATTELARLAMLTLTDTGDMEALADLSGRYDIELPGNGTLIEQVLASVGTLVRWGREGAPTVDRYGLSYHPAERISFEDMVCLPVALGLPIPQFDLCLIDEAQDFNRAQQELLLRTRAATGRAVWVGDRRQSIYAFTGADAQSFDRIREMTGAHELPLSICYRCSKSVVSLASRLVPQIKPSDSAIDGQVAHISEEELQEKIIGFWRANSQEEFLVVCRVTAPLISLAFKLLQRGVPAQVKGRDIGRSLISLLDELESSKGFQIAAWGASVATFKAVKLEALGRRKNPELVVAAFIDRMDSLEAVHEGLKIREGRVTIESIRGYLQRLFSDDAGAITLSTIHKAKGLEAKRVAILKPQLLPHPMAHLAEDLEQERNLAYVAITRAKEELYIAGYLDLEALKG
jgi:superfamily I DNA/RNA helicase